MAAFGCHVHDQQLFTVNGTSKVPVVVYLLDNSCITIAVDNNTTVEEATKQVAVRVGLPKVLTRFFGLFMSADGSVLSQRGLAHDIVVDMVDQCAKIVFAPRLMVPRLLDNKKNPVVVRLLFAQLVHDFVIDCYKSIDYDQGLQLAALCVYAKYGDIEIGSRTKTFLEPRLFEFLPARLLMKPTSSKHSTGRRGRNNQFTSTWIRTTINHIWDHYDAIDRTSSSVDAMNAAIHYARSIPEVEHLWLCSNSLVQCRQQILTLLKSRCLLGCSFDGIYLFSISGLDPGVRKFYSMDTITKWGWSKTTGQLYFEILTGSNNSSSNNSSSSSSSIKKKKKKMEGKYIETQRAADICDTLSCYARCRVKERTDDSPLNVVEATDPSSIRKRSSFSTKKSTKAMSTTCNRLRRHSTMMVRTATVPVHDELNAANKKQYTNYAHYVSIMLQALWRGYKARLAFDFLIEIRIQGLEDYDEDYEEQEEEDMEGVEGGDGGWRGEGEVTGQRQVFVVEATEVEEGEGIQIFASTRQYC